MIANYFQLGTLAAFIIYFIWIEIRIGQLSREVRLFKERQQDEAITKAVHGMSNSALDYALSDHIGGTGD